MTIRAALEQGSRLLNEGGVAAPRLTAEVLLSHALGRGRTYLYSHPEEELDGETRREYARSLSERAEGKPTQYITGRQEFYGREFQVGPGVFIPRPETEHVVETALRVAPEARAILDAACGSGAIAVTLSLEMRRPVFASDISARALAAARGNALRLGADVRLVRCNLSSAFAARSFDLLVSNPPYIPEPERDGLPREVRDHEPQDALFAGPEGLDAYRILAADAGRVLRPGGRIVFEIGYQQAGVVQALFGAEWGQVEVVPDLAGLPRVITARYAPASPRP